MKQRQNPETLSILIISLLLLVHVYAGEGKKHNARTDANINDTKYIDYSDSLTKIFDVTLFSISNDVYVEKTIKNMTLEEKAGQVLFPAIYGNYNTNQTNRPSRIKKLVETYKSGGLLFISANAENLLKMTNYAQELAEIPLLMSADFERRVSSGGIEFPHAMALGATYDAELVYQMASIIAEQGKMLGIHQNFAPVSDINNNPLNPIINVRSFGEEPFLVNALSNAYIRGTQQARMLSTSKHFPGHGNTHVDTHRDLALIETPLNMIYDVELSPFISNINNGVMSVMVGHLGLPSYDASELPASISPTIMTTLLQDELRFHGLIVTDAMNMRAITRTYDSGEAAVRALKAGCDMVLFPDDVEDAYNGILEALKSGEITEERIDHSIRKILLAKRWLGLDKKNIQKADGVLEELKNSEYQKLAETIAEKSITMVKDDMMLVPLHTNWNQTYHHFAFTDNGDNETPEVFSDYLREGIESIGSSVVISSDSWRRARRSSRTKYEKERKAIIDSALIAADSVDIFLISMYLKTSNSVNGFELDKEQQALYDTLLSKGKPIVFLSHGSPYMLMNEPDISTYLCSYSRVDVSEKALAEALLGYNDIQGRLPVSIPNTPYVAGDGIVLRALIDNEFYLIGDLVEKQSNFGSIDSLIENAIVEETFPGGVLLISKDNEIIYHKAYGRYTYSDTSKAMTKNTIFDMASVSKVIATTTATMICVDKKYFSLDDKVAEYIPEFGVNGKEHITIENLLLHNSGLIPFRRYWQFCSGAEDVIKHIYADSLVYETGSEMRYSDLGIITLGKVIEKVSGKTLDVFCRDEIFRPLEMEETFYNPPKEYHDRIAPTEIDNYWRNRLLIGEVHDETASLLDGVAGHAGLFSTTSDLVKILQMLLDKGVYGDKRLINAETIKRFTSKQSEISNRGYGWAVNEGRTSAGTLFSETSYGHTGYTGTSVWTDPEKELVVIFLTNRVYPSRENTKIVPFRKVLHTAIIESLNQIERSK